MGRHPKFFVPLSELTEEHARKELLPLILEYVSEGWSVGVAIGKVGLTHRQGRALIRETPELQVHIDKAVADNYANSRSFAEHSMRARGMRE